MYKIGDKVGYTLNGIVKFITFTNYVHREIREGTVVAYRVDRNGITYEVDTGSVDEDGNEIIRFLREIELFCPGIDKEQVREISKNRIEIILRQEIEKWNENHTEKGYNIGDNSMRLELTSFQNIVYYANLINKEVQICINKNSSKIVILSDECNAEEFQKGL